MIYFIREAAGGRIKIGFAVDPWSRMKSLQTGAPCDLEMMAIQAGDRKAERDLHRKFAADRLRGEWFQASPPLTAYVASLDKPCLRAESRRSRVFWGGKTDQELAAMVGVSRGYITNLRLGRRQPSLTVAIKLAAITDIPAHAFIMDPAA